MAENYSYIPTRLKSAVKGGHVTGADQVIHDDKGQTVNVLLDNVEAGLQDRYTKSETYNKSELNNMITTPANKVVSTAATALTTDVTEVLPATGSADTIYRVGCWDGTQYTTNVYSEYAWKGTEYQFLCAKDYGMDDTPTENSTNWVKSGGIYKYLEDIISDRLPDYKFALTDRLTNIIAAVLPNDKFKVFLDIVAESINDVPTPKVITTDTLKIAFLDSSDNIIFGIDSNDKIISSLFDVDILYGKSNAYLKETEETIVDRQKHLEPILLNDCNYDYNPSYNQHEDMSQNTLRKKRLQLAVVTDTHLMDDTFKAGVDAATGFVSIDATLQLGDMCNWCDPDSDTYTNTKAIIDAAKKPLFITPGNHDVGTRTQYVRYCKDDVQLYNRFVKPAVDRGWLKAANPSFTYKKNGENVSFPKVAEYQENKVYYYHDFDDFKVRLIMLYPMDDGNVFDETYWTPVDRDSDYPNIKAQEYAAGDKVNVPGYNTYSFEAVQNVTVTRVSKSTGSYDEAFAYVPRFKALRRGVWYGQDQLDWLCDRLDEAGEHGYLCLICQHYALINNNVTFDITTRWQNPYYLAAGSYEWRYGDDDKNIISQIVNAYQTEGTIQKSLHAISTTHEGNDGGYDDTSSIPDVTINKTFEHGGRVLFMNGHNHRDNIARSNVYDQLCVGLLSGTLFEVYPNDVMRSETPEGKDSVNVVTVYQDSSHGYVHLTRLGNTLTNRVGEDNRLVKKDNEILTF